MSVPADIPGLGSTAQKIRPNPAFDALKAGIGPEEYFVLSRIDGALTLREILLTTGLAMDRAIETVVKLRKLGAILMPGETSMSAPRAGQPTPSAKGSQSGRWPVVNPATAQGSRPPTAPIGGSQNARAPTQGGARNTGRMQTVEEVGPAMDDTFDLDKSLPQPNAEEQAALAETCDLDDDDRRTMLAMARRLGWGDAWSTLGLPPNAEKRRVKRAYFKLSKEFHPDRYFGKKLGSFAQRLERIFEALTRAYTELTDTRARTGETGKLAKNPGEAQSPTEYAAELYDRACQTEVHGDPLEAMKQFAAAIRIDPQVKYLRRAARCALTAGQPRSAEEYANKAANLEPNDASTSRLLASAFRAQNKLEAAEEVLIMALAMPSENDALVQELRRDLAEIRRAMASGSAR